MVPAQRRFLLFSFGFLIGCVGVYFMLFRGQDRDYWLPGNRVKDQVKNSKVIFSDYALCIMKCRNISEADVQHILLNGDVNFSESDIRNAVCPSYAFEGNTIAGTSLRVVCTACDSVAHISTAVFMNAPADTCRCK